MLQVHGEMNYNGAELVGNFRIVGYSEVIPDLPGDSLTTPGKSGNRKLEKSTSPVTAVYQDLTVAAKEKHSLAVAQFAHRPQVRLTVSVKQ